MDTGSGDILAVEFTSSREGDSPVLHDLLEQIPPDQEIGTVTGDGAFDTHRCHAAILARGGTAIIPIRKYGRFWKEDLGRGRGCVRHLRIKVVRFCQELRLCVFETPCKATILQNRIRFA